MSALTSTCADGDSQPDTSGTVLPEADRPKFLCLVGKPAVFVPSPNVAEDHQTKNAMALVEKDAAAMVRDDEAVHGVFPAVEKLLADPQRMERMRLNMMKLGVEDSAERIVDEILDVVKR